MKRFLRTTALPVSNTRELSQKFIKTHVPKNLSDKEVRTQATRAFRANPTKEINTSLGPRHNVEQQEKIFKKQVQEGQLKADPRGQYKFTIDRSSSPVNKRETDMTTQTIGKPQEVKGVSVGLDPKGDWHHLGDTFKKGGKVPSCKKKRKP